MKKQTKRCKHEPKGSWVDIVYEDGSHLMIGPKVCRFCEKKLEH